MAVLLQQLINGFFIGSVYGLFAVGYTLVFGVLDILNLAHAAIFTLGGLTALWLTTAAGLSIWIAFPLAALFSGTLGLVLDRVAFVPLRRRADSNLSGLISSIAMAIIFESVALGIFGARTVRFPEGIFLNRVWRFESVTSNFAPGGNRSDRPGADAGFDCVCQVHPHGQSHTGSCRERTYGAAARHKC